MSKFERVNMSYMNASDFCAPAGIQELRFDEIDFVNGAVNWRKVGNSFVGGAIGGAVGGAVTGGITGAAFGPGALVGAAVGAAAGGWGGGLAAATTEIYNTWNDN
jgi:hypothetical protein